MNMTYIKARHKAERLVRGAPQYLELKQLIDAEDRFRRHCREMLGHYRRWKNGRSRSDDPIERHYGALEGGLLRGQAEAAVHLYTVIRKDRRRSVTKYLQSGPNIKF